MITITTALVALALAGCSGANNHPTPDAVSGERAFDAPAGVAAHERYIVVANSAFHFEGTRQAWRPGFVTLVERHTRRVVAKIPTSQPNPQYVTVSGDRAYVVNTGTVAVDDDGLAIATGDGGLDVIDLSGDLSGDAPPTTVAYNIPLPRSADDARIGAYGTVAISPDGRRAVIGSGTRGDLFVVDLQTRKVLRGADNPLALFATKAGENGLTVTRRVGDQLAVADFNSDQLCLLPDWSDLTRRTCGAVGVNAELLEGPIDVALAADGRLLVLMSIANALYRIDPANKPWPIDDAFATTGLANNRVVVRGRFAYVVNSQSNNLQRVTLSDGRSEQPFAVLPVGSNPFDMTLPAAAGARAWVTLLASDQLAVIDLDSGEVVETLGPHLAPSANADGGASRGDAGLDAPACGDGGAAAAAGIVNVVSVAYGEGAGHGQERMPEVIQGGPTGGGSGGGSVRGVLSLGSGGEIVVDFGALDIVDGPGPDFIVFENPLLTAPYQPFAEPAIVGVSATSSAAADFVDFSCDLSQKQGDPATQTWPYPGCAGVRPVLANVETGCIAPDDAQVAGGDPFDLATVGLSRARYLRLRDAAASPAGSTTRGFDLDAVVVIHGAPRD